MSRPCRWESQVVGKLDAVFGNVERLAAIGVPRASGLKDKDLSADLLAGIRWNPVTGEVIPMQIAALQLRVQAACFDSGYQTGAVLNVDADRPHNLRGANVLRSDASVRWLPPPWDPTDAGNYHSGSLFWSVARAN